MGEHGYVKAPAPKPIGAVIRERRAALGLSLRDVAKLCKVSVPFVSDIENGKRCPSATVCDELAYALDVSPRRMRSLAIAACGRCASYRAEVSDGC